MEKTRMKEHLFDKRVVQRALQEGLLKEEEYQRMLDALPDLSDRLQTSDLSASHESEDDLDDQDDQDDQDDDEDDELDESEDENENADAPTPNAFSSDV
jgi:hypothetical protein